MLIKSNINVLLLTWLLCHSKCLFFFYIIVYVCFNYLQYLYLFWIVWTVKICIQCIRKKRKYNIFICQIKSKGIAVKAIFLYCLPLAMNVVRLTTSVFNVSKKKKKNIVKIFIGINLYFWSTYMINTCINS